MAPILTTLSLWGHAAPLYGYGAMLSLAVLVGSLHLLIVVHREGWDVGAVLACLGAGLLSGFAGAHGLFLLVAVMQGQDPVASLGRGGIVFLGGALCGGLGFATMARALRLPVLALLDAAVIPMAVGHAIGRVGCFLGGCCYGRPFDGPWAVTYSHTLAPVHDGVPRHPVQLYEALLLIVLALLLASTRRAQPAGTRLALYLIGYPLVRALTETLRGDAVRGLFLGHAVSTSQLLAAPLLALGLTLLFRLRPRHGKP